MGVPRTGPLDLDRAVGWLAPSRLAGRGGGVQIAAGVRAQAAARRELPRLRRILDRLPGVRATLAGERLDVRSRGRPRLRLAVQGGRALIFLGPIPGPSRRQARDTAAYREATRLLGGPRLTALAVRPRRGVAFVAVGGPRTGAMDRASGARVVISLR